VRTAWERNRYIRLSVCRRAIVFSQVRHLQPAQLLARPLIHRCSWEQESEGCTILSTRTALSSPWMALSGLVDDREQRFQGEPTHRPSASTEQYLRRLGGVCRDLDPCLHRCRARHFRLAANDHLRIEARHFLCQLFWPDGRHFDARAQQCDASRNHLAVGAVIVLEGYQDPNAFLPPH
jgi:hypothetical protein